MVILVVKSEVTDGEVPANTEQPYYYPWSSPVPRFEIARAHCMVRYMCSCTVRYYYT